MLVNGNKYYNIISAILRLYDNNILCQTRWLKHLFENYASLIVLVYIDSLKKYVGESLNSIGQWDCNLQATPPNWR